MIYHLWEKDLLLGLAFKKRSDNLSAQNKIFDVLSKCINYKLRILKALAWYSNKIADYNSYFFNEFNNK